MARAIGMSVNFIVVESNCRSGNKRYTLSGLDKFKKMLWFKKDDDQFIVLVFTSSNPTLRSGESSCDTQKNLQSAKVMHDAVVLAIQP